MLGLGGPQEDSMRMLCLLLAALGEVAGEITVYCLLVNLFPMTSKQKTSSVWPLRLKVTA